MTLTKMIDWICTKVGQTDTESKADCRIFIEQRWEYLWDNALWKDSLVQYNYTHDPATGNLEAAGITLLPSGIERVVAVRETNRSLHPTNWETVFRGNYDRFNEEGTSIEYFTEAPTCWADPLGKTIELQASQPGTDAGVKVWLRWTDLLGAQLELEWAIDGASKILAGGKAVSIDAFAKPTTTGSVNVRDTDTPADVGTLLAGETGFPRLLRLHYIEKPKNSFAAKILGKRPRPSFSHDFDEPAIRNASNFLLAMGHADMLERARQYGKAREKLGETGAMLVTLKLEEALQEANSPQLIPWGMSDENYEYSWMQA